MIVWRLLTIGVAVVVLALSDVAATQAPSVEAAFPGTNGKIAFLQPNGAGVATVNPDGSGQSLLVANAQQGRWSADGRKITFVKDGDIWVADADGSGSDNVTDTPGETEFEPSWSPDGTKIVFRVGSPGDDGDTDLYVIGVDGSGKTNITNTPGALEFRPAWSPSGTRIVFERYDGVGGGIALINPDGSGFKSLATGQEADWSPDGTKIAFVRFTAAECCLNDIFTMNSDGSDARAITSRPGTYTHPAWSPDGTMIVYGTDILPRKISVMSADGSGRRHIADGTWPDWQPLPGQCPGTASVASPAATDDDTDGDNIPDNVENNITHTDPGCQDTDGDGLLDPWEVAENVEGAGFDLDDDGDAEVKRDAVFGPYNGGCLDLTGPRFERLGQHCGLVQPPDPLHKDVYVEMDWQDCFEGNCPEMVPGMAVDPSHHSPDMAGLLNVVNMFGSAPVENPDESDGVNLHILVDEPIKHIHNCDQAPAATRATNFGTEDQREDANATHILEAKAMAFRYAWSGHSSIKDDTPNDCPLPSLFTIGLAGAGLGTLPFYDTSPPGHALPGGRDVLVTLAVSWICQLYSFGGPFGLANFPPCFRKIIGITTVIAPGLFPADIALPNGGSEEVPLPMHMLLGIPPGDAVEQLWGRTFAHYLGTALGVPPGSLGNNPRTTGAQPVNTYGTWGGVSYAPPSGASVQSLAPAGGVEEPILPDYTLADQDQDGDDTVERDDNCPALSNVGQSDIDGDGAGDVCDDDPDGDGLLDAGDAEPDDTDNDGTPNATDADDDADGQSDGDDNCPVAANPAQEDADTDDTGDACDIDNDGDGLPNSFETLVGTDPDNPAGTPEFIGNGESCSDGLDNDGDGDTDAADDGCLDPDGDTVPTSIDNCPALATNNLQDSDGDGTGNACEPVGDPHLWGDNDCDAGISSRDNQALSRLILQQNALSQTQPCPVLGSMVSVSGVGQKAWGDLDCDGEITSRDGQSLLRKVLQQNALSQTQPCPVLGDLATTSPAAVAPARVRWWR